MQLEKKLKLKNYQNTSFKKLRLRRKADRCFFFKWAILGLFFFIFVFSIIHLVDKLVDKILPMMGLKLRISGVRSDRSTNWATTIAKQRDAYVLFIRQN